MKQSSKKLTRVHKPYAVLPSHSSISTSQWRQQKATAVDTEIIKPESYLPVTTGSTGRSPICFTIKGVPHSRIDGGNIFLETAFVFEKFDKTKKEWIPTTDQDNVLPIANTYCSMFEDLNISINGVQVENSQRDFTIKAYLQNLLFSTQPDRDTWLQSGLLALDAAPAFHQVLSSTSSGFAGVFAKDLGQYMRQATVKKSTNLLYGKLLSDVLNCSEPLPDNVDINIKLFPAKSEACLVQTVASSGAIEYRIKITDCSLYVPRITTKTNVNVDRMFTYTNWRVLAYTHQASQTNFKKDIAIGESLPQKAMVVFLPENTYNGAWGKSKVGFGHENAVSVLMKCNHKHLPFTNGYKCDWTNDLFHTAYVGLTTELGARGHSIKYWNFDDGYAIFGFDLTANKTGDMAAEHPMKGALELDIEFNPVPTQNLMVIVVLIYADKFVISKNGTFSSM